MMTIQKISFRDFIRGQIPADILLLLDRKSNKSKGLYISPKYADDVLAFVEKRERERKEKKKHALLDFVGVFGEVDDTAASHQKIKASKYE